MSGLVPGSNAWVVAADHSRARFFLAPVPTAPLQEIDDLVNPVALQRESDLVSDRPGQISKAGNSRAVGHHQNHKDHAAEQFASQICLTLKKARNADSLDRLYLIAEPKFLGLLRRHMDPVIRGIVVGEIDKNVTKHTPAELRALLPKQL